MGKKRAARVTASEKLKRKGKQASASSEPGPGEPLADGESLADKRKRARWIVKQLHKLYPQADCALERRNGFELLIATVLSAQTTDESVNKVTPELFSRYPGPEKLAQAKPAEVEAIVRPTGFYRQKTKNILGIARALCHEHNGQVPDSMDQLVQLPGVARKTANVVLGTWFGKNEGMVVDTHIGRLAHRLGLTWTSKDSKDAVKIERDLMAVLAPKEWNFMGHALIWHGRRICSARKPECENCPLQSRCPSAYSFG